MESEIELLEEDLLPDDDFIPPHIQAKALKPGEKTFPKKSKVQYLKVYNKFNAWREANNIKGLSEIVFLAYFEDLSETMAPGSLWSIYSMLRSTVQNKHNINIHDYSGVIAFLKQTNKGYKPKKAKTLTAEELRQFFLNAPDEQYLAAKVFFPIIKTLQNPQCCLIFVCLKELKFVIFLVLQIFERFSFAFKFQFLVLTTFSSSMILIGCCSVRNRWSMPKSGTLRSHD